MANETNYPEYRKRLASLVEQLGGEIPSTISGFGRLHKSAVADGALDMRTKELIALGIAVAVRCDGCIAYHVDDAILAGANRDEIIETLGVSILMGGGPALMYAAEAFEALDQFMAEKEPA